MDYYHGSTNGITGLGVGAKAGPGALTPTDAIEVQCQYLEPLVDA